MIESWFADMAMESGFARFVQAIAHGRESGECHTFAECLASPGVNPLHRAGVDDDLRFTSDCADFAYGLRAYYLLRTGRPFYYVRFDGTRRVIRPWAGGETPYEPVARFLRDEVSTDLFRYPGAKRDSETYRVRVDPATIVPGTLFSDPEGHVLVVYRVLPDGTIHMVDSQPSGRMNIKRVMADMYEPGPPSAGGGFRRWRPFTSLHAMGEGSTVGVLPAPDFALVDAAPRIEKRNPDTAIDKGGAGNEGNRGNEGNDERHGNERYWAEVRRGVARSDSRVDPVLEFGDRVDQLCDDVADRVHAVDLAGLAGLTRLLPERLLAVPDDPFSTNADPAWERHSSPSRDLRLRRGFLSLKAFVGSSLDAAARGDDSKYRTTVPAPVLLSLYKARLEAAARSPRCAVAYTDSAGGRRVLDLRTVAGRLPDLGFDPVLCPELRWGAVPWAAEAATASEASTCVSDVSRWQRYVEQAAERLRLDRVGVGAVSPPPGTIEPAAAAVAAATLRDLDPFHYLEEAGGLIAMSGTVGAKARARTP